LAGTAVSASEWRPPAVGDLLFLKESEYKPGVGPLRLRVTAVGEFERHEDGPWLNLRGVDVYPDGSPITGRERYVLVWVTPLLRRSLGVGGRGW
jgi:hypothetical protein